MGNKMLIDAAHPEETRVVVLRGNRVEEFDFEAQSRKQLRGSIFLAKVIRVEPSLQAAFVDYGGNRHGFLAFSEIHPDYYRIPYADAQSTKPDPQKATLACENAVEDDEPQESKTGPDGSEAAGGGESEPGEGELAAPESDAEMVDAAVDATSPLPDEAEGEVMAAPEPEKSGGRARSMPLEAPVPSKVSEALEETAAPPAAIETVAEIAAAPASESEALPDEAPSLASGGNVVDVYESVPAPGEDGDEALSADEAAEQASIESVGGEDAMEELPQRERPRRRLYKIQEVIKRNQILLVQVVKEERGTKGAALTTYLSLAGRYTVLMPNTASGGGISRKITLAADRKRLREIANELDVPPGMGLIIRTAGASRTKAEIKRDFEYLLRLWENVRELTLKSKAPTLVYEEGDLIKRSIRDLYNREIDEILVAGEDAYRDAKDFMRMLMPSHAKNVQLYKEAEPIFTKYNVESQLNMMFNPRVTLKSGGYIIINQTEALVAIDVNSGKSTREHSIEETALKTNLEAAEEISRQLRLRDLAGLIVIDFIDMEERRNNRAVERKLKDCLRNDRARIQVGRISPFGLLEMSRQRLRTGMVEGSTKPCHFCDGTGVIRSTESVALMVLRAIEDHLIAKGPANLAATTSVDAALYILNNKRSYLRDIENRYGVSVTILASEHMHGAGYTIEKLSSASPRQGEQPKTVQMSWAHLSEDEFGEEEAQTEHERETAAAGERSESRSRRRRRRKRFRNGHENGLDHRPGGHREAEAGEAAHRAHLHYETNGVYSSVYGPAGEGEHAAEDIMEAGEPSRPEHHADEGLDEQRRPRRSRRRGRRGGHRQRAMRLSEGQEAHEAAEPAPAPAEPETPASQPSAVEAAPPAAESAAEIAASAPPAPETSAERKPRAQASRRNAAPSAASEESVGIAASPAPAEAAPTARETAVAVSAPPAPALEEAAKPAAPPAQDEPKPRKVGPVRVGWWQRRIGG